MNSSPFTSADLLRLRAAVAPLLDAIPRVQWDANYTLSIYRDFHRKADAVRAAMGPAAAAVDEQSDDTSGLPTVEE